MHVSANVDINVPIYMHIHFKINIYIYIWKYAIFTVLYPVVIYFRYALVHTELTLLGLFCVCIT